MCIGTMPAGKQRLCSQPVQLAEIDRLNLEKDVTQVCPFYLDLLSEAARLQVRLHVSPFLLLLCVWCAQQDWIASGCHCPACIYHTASLMVLLRTALLNHAEQSSIISACWRMLPCMPPGCWQ